jgi:hypothetical protein
VVSGWIRDLNDPGSSPVSSTQSARNFFEQEIYSHLLGSTQPFIHLRSINRVPVSTGVMAGLFASAGWQVTLCDPIWYATSRSCEMCTLTLYTS